MSWQNFMQECNTESSVLVVAGVLSRCSSARSTPHFPPCHSPAFWVCLPFPSVISAPILPSLVKALPLGAARLNCSEGLDPLRWNKNGFNLTLCGGGLTSLCYNTLLSASYLSGFWGWYKLLIKAQWFWNKFQDCLILFFLLFIFQTGIFF